MSENNVRQVTNMSDSELSTMNFTKMLTTKQVAQILGVSTMSVSAWKAETDSDTCLKWYQPSKDVFFTPESVEALRLERANKEKVGSLESRQTAYATLAASIAKHQSRIDILVAKQNALGLTTEEQAVAMTVKVALDEN